MVSPERRRVVVIAARDDDTRSAVQRFLGRAGYDALVAGSVQHALEIVGTAAPDILLFSTRLDGTSAPDAVRQTQRDHPSVPIIVLCGLDESQTAVECLKVGAYDYLLAPVDFEELELTLDRALAFRATAGERQDLLGALQEHRERLATIGSLATELEEIMASVGDGVTEEQLGEMRALVEQMVRHALEGTQQASSAASTS